MNTLTRKDLILLALLTLSWGFNWPIMKIGVQDFPPLTFRTLGMLGGLIAIWLAARMQRASLAIPKGEVMTVIKLAIPNMLLWHALIICGIRLLSSGRAAILGYTMPVWAMLAGLVFFGERISRASLIGIALAFTGALLLLSSEFSKLSGQPLGTVLALLALLSPSAEVMALPLGPPWAAALVALDPLSAWFLLLLGLQSELADQFRDIGGRVVCLSEQS